MEIKQYQNKYGNLTLLVGDYKKVNTFRAKNIDDEYFFSMDDAEKIVLITDNKRMQIAFDPDNLKRAYVLVHQSPSEAALGKIQELNFISKVNPADEISLRRHESKYLPIPGSDWGKEKIKLNKPKGVDGNQDHTMKKGGSASTIYFHGTNDPESIRKNGFTLSKETDDESSFLGDNFAEGIYLSKNTEPYEEGGQLEDVVEVLKVTITAKNILKVNGFKGIDTLNKKYKISMYSEDGGKLLTKALKKAGYDGLDIGDELIIFNPKNVHLITKDLQLVAKHPEFEIGNTVGVKSRGNLTGIINYISKDKKKIGIKGFSDTFPPGDLIFLTEHPSKPIDPLHGISQIDVGFESGGTFTSQWDNPLLDEILPY